METKRFWKSKTIIANVIMVSIVALQVATGSQILDPDVQAMLIAMLNLLLRFKATMPIV